MERRTKLALTASEVNLLREALSYCDLAASWDDDGFDSEDLDGLPDLLVRLDAAAHRLDTYALVD